MKGGYSVVIATCDRDEPLTRVLEDWSAQTAPPEKVVVVEAGASGRHGSPKGGDEANVTRLVSSHKSAARQRNLGAEEVETEWIAFCDDDVRFPPDFAAMVLEFLAAHPDAVAVSPRMRGASHPCPGRWLRRYYGLQAGFPDETYGGRLFGAGITCYPCWEAQPAPVEANWLPSTMLWMKTEAFRRQKFPDFAGYGFGECASDASGLARCSTGGRETVFHGCSGVRAPFHPKRSQSRPFPSWSHGRTQSKTHCQGGDGKGGVGGFLEILCASHVCHRGSDQGTALRMGWRNDRPLECMTAGGPASEMTATASSDVPMVVRIGIVTRKSEDLRKCLASCVVQTYKPKESSCATIPPMCRRAG